MDAVHSVTLLRTQAHHLVNPFIHTHSFTLPTGPLAPHTHSHQGLYGQSLKTNYCHLQVIGGGGDTKGSKAITLLPFR